jgi:hypothetical protein
MPWWFSGWLAEWEELATLVIENGASSATFPNVVLVNENPGIFTLSGQGTEAVLN